MKSFVSTLFIIATFSCQQPLDDTKINREAVVSRHNVEINRVDTLNSLTLGNGNFAMTMDVTGLQSFPEIYKNGVPLGTQSIWGWHSFPTEENYQIEETLAPIKSHGREVPYARQWPADTRRGEAANYLRQNPHRIHLANIGWSFLDKNGEELGIKSITNINQTLDLWNGELISRFMIDDENVKVISMVDQETDELHVRVESNLIMKERLSLKIKYPYPTGAWLNEGVTYDDSEPLQLKLTRDRSNLSIKRQIDSLTYFTSVASTIKMEVKNQSNGFLFKPENKASRWEFSVSFSEKEKHIATANFEQSRSTVNKAYEDFWTAGGMMDFGATEEPAAYEIERRMILSMYLTQVNCSGAYPPQETGLTYNSWYGKPHLEMHWWHGVHFALWGRPDVLQKQLEWYKSNQGVARGMAQRQGFKGVRWQKMTDHRGGETSSSVGSYLIWQQPHLIYFSELLFQTTEDSTLLAEFEPLITSTADFMADFAWYDEETKRYILGPGVMPAQERYEPQDTYNPTFELAYWKWALQTAINWRKRLNLPPRPDWVNVVDNLSQLPFQDGVYLSTENATDSYTNSEYMTDHPSLLAAYGLLPQTPGLDTALMRATFDKVWNEWQWQDTWGWDFPMAAMTATRLGLPDKAIGSLLMPITTNTYLKNGHNYQNETLRIYLPGNGGYLTALALMAVGSRDAVQRLPGFPKDWKVKVEGITPML